MNENSKSTVLSETDIKQIQTMIHDGIDVNIIADFFHITVEDLMINNLIPATVNEYIIPVSYQMFGFIKVKGVSINDAVAAANQHSNILPLPEMPIYVTDSYSIESNEDIIEKYTHEYKTAGHIDYCKPTDTHITSDLAKAFHS